MPDRNVEIPPEPADPSPRRPRKPPGTDNTPKGPTGPITDAGLPKGPIIDGGLPDGPIIVQPDEDGAPPPKEVVEALDPGLPVALFPVGLATRFVRRAGASLPDRLRIRIIPDPILVDEHRAALTSYEAELGRAYWKQLFAVGVTGAAAEAVKAWLVDSLGAPRARWVARQSRPTNNGQLDGTTPPKFGPVDIDDTPDPAIVVLLPERWIVQVRTGDGATKRYASRPIDHTHPLVVAPQLVGVQDPSTARGFLEGQGLRWRTDFDAAVAAGMALEIPVDGEARRLGFAEVFVFGVRAGDQSGAVVSLLDHHRYGAGLTLVPTGTPTNNTDDVRVPVVEPSAPELDPEPVERATIKSPPTGVVPLFELPNGDALTAALGLGDVDVLDDAPTADRTDGKWARAMNAVLWPGLSVQLFDHLLNGTGPVISGADRAWLRDWFVDFVRGGPMLSTIAVGATPYGVLPTMALSDEPAGPGTGDTLGRFVNEVLAWEGVWNGSSAAALSPVLDIEPTEAGQAVEVAAILGAVPNPAALRVRPAPLDREDITDSFLAAGTQLGEMVEALPPPHGATIQSFYEDHRQRVDGEATALGQTSSLGTFVFWVDNNAFLFDDLDPNPARTIIDHVEQVMIPMLDDHHSRTRSITIVENLGVGKLPWPTDPDLWYVNYGDIDADAPVVSLLGDPVELLDGLEERLAMAESRAAGGDPTVDTGAARPLLFVLIDQSIRYADDDGEAMVVDGLRTLRDLARDQEDASELLDRIAREALGPFGHRIDAWRTSVAAERLAAVRAKRPRGLQTGCYGFVVDLRPDDAGPDTQGFLHAPSLDHAAAGAMLRSAWRGLGASATDAPYAVDLSSERVRRAAWLLDGIRNGHELGNLLGQRFERRLHDAHLDAYVEDARAAVLAAAGHEGEPAVAIVDGLAIATAYRESEAGSDLHGRLEAIRLAAPVADRQPLREVFESATSDFDAVADVLMTQGVVAPVQGNVDATAATTATVGSNPGGVPELTVADISSSGHVVSHRVLAVFPTESPAAAGPLPRQVTPAVDDWLTAMLPSFADRELTVRWPALGDLPAIRRTVTLGALGVTASHLVAWCLPDVPTESSRLAQFATAVVSDTGETRAGQVDASDVEEVAVIAGALRQALGGGRPLNPSDLVDATAVSDAMVEAATLDLAELGARADLASAHLRSIADHAGGNGDRIAWAADAALCEFGAVIAACRDTGLAASLADALRARADALESADRADPDGLARALGSVLESALPVLPELVLTDPESLVAAAAAGTALLRDRVPSWLMATARVHDGVEAVHQAILLSEMVRDQRSLEASLVQYPAVAGDGWAALDLPDFSAWRSRMCLLGITDLGAAAARGRVSGIVFDAWTEVVPGSEVTTGVAIHFDRPSSRAPQAILLTTPAAGQPWTVSAMFDTLQQTLRAAENRAVGPETLASHGHLLPAVFLDGGAVVLTEEALAASQSGEER